MEHVRPSRHGQLAGAVVHSSPSLRVLVVVVVDVVVVAAVVAVVGASAAGASNGAAAHITAPVHSGWPSWPQRGEVGSVVVVVNVVVVVVVVFVIVVVAVVAVEVEVTVDVTKGVVEVEGAVGFVVTAASISFNSFTASLHLDWPMLLASEHDPTCKANPNCMRCVRMDEQYRKRRASGCFTFKT